MKFREHIGKYGILYIILALGIGLFVGYNWNTWFPGETENGVPVLDTNGNPTGRRTSNINPSVARQRACCAVAGGFIGGCKYPIKATDKIPSCDETL